MLQLLSAAACSKAASLLSMRISRVALRQHGMQGVCYWSWNSNSGACTSS